MPRIQLPQSRNTIQDQVPGADLMTRSQGQEGGSMADFGQAVTNFGAHMLQKQVEAQAADYGFTKEYEDKLAIKEYGDKLKKETQPGGNDYSKKMQEFIKQRSDVGRNEAPTELARISYIRKSEGLHTNAMIDAENYEQNTNAKYQIDNITKASDLQERLYNSSPDYNTYKDTVKSLHDQVDLQVKSNLINPQDVIRMKTQIAQQQALAIFSGLKAQQRYGEALKLLDSTKGESDVAKGLSGEQKGQLLNQFTNLEQQKSETNLHSLRQDAKDFQYAALTNGKIDQGLYTKIVTGLTTNKNIKPDERKRFLDDLRTTIQASGEMQKLNNMSTDQLLNYQPKIDTKSTFNSASRAETAAHLVAYRNQLLKKRENDPMAEIMNQNEKLRSLGAQAQNGDPKATQEYLSQGLAAQAQLGVPNPRVTTNQEAVLNSKKLESAPSAAAADLVLQNMQRQYGDYLPKALDEMSKNNKDLGHDYVIAAYMPQQSSRISAIDNLRNQKEINKTFDDVYKGMKPNLESSIARSSNDLRASLLQRSGFSNDNVVYNAFSKQIELEAKKNLSRDSGLNPDVAVQQAYNKIVGENFNVVPAEKSSVIVPKTINGSYLDPKSVESFVSLKSRPEGLKSLNLYVPQSFKDSENWYNLIAEKGRWVTNSSMTGLQLVMNDPTSGKTLALVDKNKKPIQVSFKDIIVSAPKIQEESTKWFKKIVPGGLSGGY